MSEAPGNALTGAPEVFETGQYTMKVDVYSYAVCLYLLFAKATTLDDRPTDTRPLNARNLPTRVGAGARFVRKEGIPDFYWDLITKKLNRTDEHNPFCIDQFVSS